MPPLTLFEPARDDGRSALVRLLKNEDANVRLRAANALLQEDDPQGKEALRQCSVHQMPAYALRLQRS